MERPGTLRSGGTLRSHVGGVSITMTRRWVPISVALLLAASCRNNDGPRPEIGFRGPVAPFVEGKWRSLYNCEKREPNLRFLCGSSNLDGSLTRAIEVDSDSTLVSQLITLRIAPESSVAVIEGRRARLSKHFASGRQCAPGHWTWEHTGGLGAVLAIQDEPLQSGRPRVMVIEWIGTGSVPEVLRCGRSFGS